ncbi:MAG: hypothetical protein Q9170_001201 [Blastenia crenularia]
MPLQDWLSRALGKETDFSSDDFNGSDLENRQCVPSASNAIQRPSVEPSSRNEEDSILEATEIDHLRSKLNQKEADLSALRQLYTDLDHRYRGATDKNSDLEDWTDQLTKELRSMHLDTASLKQELQACKDDLFKMQPKNRVPDSDVARSYDDLQEHVCSWIAYEISRFENKHRKTTQDPLPNLFHHGNTSIADKFLKAYPSSGGEYLVRSIIAHNLHEIVFSERIVLVGLDDAEAALLQRIERSMGRMDPPRDLDSINMWRSDTLSALSKTATFEKFQRRASRDIAEALSQQVVKYFPIVAKNESRLQELLEKIINPAVELATTIQTSPSQYIFVPTVKKFFPFDGYSVTRETLSKFKLIDIGSGKTLKPDSPVQSDEQGHIGTPIMVLAPALYRCDPGQSALLLVKEVVLVRLFKPLGRHRAAIGPSERGLERFSGVVV